MRSVVKRKRKFVFGNGDGNEVRDKVINGGKLMKGKK